MLKLSGVTGAFQKYPFLQNNFAFAAGFWSQLPSKSRKFHQIHLFFDGFFKQKTCLSDLAGFTWCPSTALHGQSFLMLQSVPRPGLDSRNGTCHQKRLHLVGWFIFFQMSRWMSYEKMVFAKHELAFVGHYEERCQEECIRVLILSCVNDDIWHMPTSVRLCPAEAQFLEAVDALVPKTNLSIRLSSLKLPWVSAKKEPSETILMSESEPKYGRRYLDYLIGLSERHPLNLHNHSDDWNRQTKTTWMTLQWGSLAKMLNLDVLDNWGFFQTEVP